MIELQPHECRVVVRTECNKRVQVGNNDFMGPLFKVEDVVDVVSVEYGAGAVVRVDVMSPEDEQKAVSLVRVNGLVRLFGRGQIPVVKDIKSFEWSCSMCVFRSPVEDCLEPIHGRTSAISEKPCGRYAISAVDMVHRPTILNAEAMVPDRA